MKRPKLPSDETMDAIIYAFAIVVCLYVAVEVAVRILSRFSA
jgi:hypothetical protein